MIKPNQITQQVKKINNRCRLIREGWGGGGRFAVHYFVNAWVSTDCLFFLPSGSLPSGFFPDLVVLCSAFLVSLLIRLCFFSSLPLSRSQPWFPFRFLFLCRPLSQGVHHSFIPLHLFQPTSVFFPYNLPVSFIFIQYCNSFPANKNEDYDKNRQRKEDDRRARSCLFVCLFGFLTSSSTTRLYRGRAPRQERLTISRAATHETELGDHDFCLSRSHYTDTDPTCRERAVTAGIEPGTSSPGVARSTAELPLQSSKKRLKVDRKRKNTIM